MIVDKKILNELSAKAKENPRLRCNLDMRNSADDQSQRMLNALEPGTVMPIHRHKGSSETCICIRGHFEEYFYDSDGRHSLKCLENGTMLFEAKDGPYHPLEEDEVWNG